MPEDDLQLPLWYNKTRATVGQSSDPRLLWSLVPTRQTSWCELRQDTIAYFLFYPAVFLGLCDISYKLLLSSTSNWLRMQLIELKKNKQTNKGACFYNPLCKSFWLMIDHDPPHWLTRVQRSDLRWNSLQATSMCVIGKKIQQVNPYTTGDRQGNNSP